MKKSAHLLLLVLSLIWMIYAYHRYLPLLTCPRFKLILAQFGEFLVTAGFLDILIVLWIWLAAYLLGKRFLETLGLKLEPGAERISISSAAGLSVLSLVALGLAALRIFYRPIAAGFLVLPLVIWFTELRRLITQLSSRRSQQTGSSYSSAQRMTHGFLLVYLTFVLGLVLISALGPPIEFDDLLYHLLTPKIYVQAHGIKAIPDIPHTFLPKNIEMLFALGMLLHNEITAKLIHYLLGILVLLLTYAFAARLSSRTMGLLASSILASSPIFLWEMRTTHIDLGPTLYVFLSLYAIIFWRLHREQSWFRLGCYSMAFALGIKYHTFFAVASLSLVVFVHHLIRCRDFPQATRETVRLGMYSAIGLLPWGIVNWVYTKNPLFPLLNSIFQSPHWNPELTQLIMTQQRDSGIPITLANWWACVTVFWHMATDQVGKFHGNIGPFFLMLIPLLLFKRRVDPAIKLILALSLIESSIWLFAGQHARYYMPLLPGLAVVAAYATIHWLAAGQTKIPKFLAGLAAIVLASMAIFNSPFFEQYGANSHYGLRILATLPLKVLMGQESKDDYLARTVANYRAVQFFNALPGEKKVLFLWKTVANAFYVEGKATTVFSTFAHQLFGNDPEQLHAVLRENRVTHIICGQPGQENHLISRPEGEFVQRYLKKLYQKNAVILYEVAPEPLRQEVTAYDFLSHICEATLRMPRKPANNANFSDRQVLGFPGNQRYVLLTFPPAEAGFHVTLGERPVLRFAIGQVIPKCAGIGCFQIWVALPKGKRDKIYERELDAETKPQDVGWFDEQIDLMAYARKTVEVIFKTEWLGGGTCYWYVWADPVILAPPN